MTTEERLAALEDRAAISEVVYRFCYALDGKDWPLYADTLDEEVFVEFLGSNFPPKTWTRQEWSDNARGLLGGFASLQHLSTNHWITLDGATAVCRATLHADHHLPGQPDGCDYLLRGRYEFQLARRDQGWRINRIGTLLAWASGNRSIVDVARATMSSRAAGA